MQRFEIDYLNCFKTHVWLGWLICIKLRYHILSKGDLVYEPGNIARQSHAWSTRELGSLRQPGNKYVMENQEKNGHYMFKEIIIES